MATTGYSGTVTFFDLERVFSYSGYMQAVRVAQADYSQSTPYTDSSMAPFGPRTCPSFKKSKPIRKLRQRLLFEVRG